MRYVASLAALLAAAVPVAASAQVTPERAQAIQDQLRTWLKSNLGSAIDLGADSVTIKAAGDHFDIAYPFPNAVGKPLVTGRLTEVEGGRWSLNDIALPSPTVFQVHVPPTKANPAGSEATTTLTFGQQSQQALLDPTMATPSTMSSTFGDLGIAMQLPNGASIGHIESGTSHTTFTPRADGRGDTASEATLINYTLKVSDRAKADAMAVAIGKATVTSSFTGLSTQRGLDLFRLLGQISQAQQAAKTTGPTPPPLDKPTQLALLAALSDLATGVSFDEQINDVTVMTSGLAGSVSRLGLGFEARSVDGKLQARLPIAAEGLRLPDLGLGDMARLVPTQVAFTPHVAALPAEAIQKLLREAIDGRRPDASDVQALFANGPLNLGIDDFRLAVGGSSFTGQAALLVASPASISGTGQIVADNLDSLQQTMSANPQTAQMAPVIVLMKGLARSEGGHLLWDIVYRDGHLLVNNQDMQALMGAMAPPRPEGPPARRPPSRPAPTRP